MEFKLTITLGNAEMQSGDNVADALRETARKLANRFDGMTLPADVDGKIIDANGNIVGNWEVSA